MVESVLSQSYPNWQLCIANGSPENGDVVKELNKFAQRDKRIEVVHLDKNMGIAGNTNAGIQLADGDYVAFLDHDDVLAPFALYETVQAIHQYPNAEIVFSDEDLLSSDGKKRYNPYFKSAFSLEFLRCNNYMCHFLVIKKSVGDRIGWLREHYDGAQDFDLILRAVEVSKFVVHIPRILYHWRALPSSTASSPEAKTYATDAGISALQSHLDRMGIEARSERAILPTNYRIHYQIHGNPAVSIIIPNRNHEPDLRRCVESLLQNTSYTNFNIVIAENHSNEEAIRAYYHTLEADPRIKILEYGDQFNYSRINNFAVQGLDSEYLLFLNNDVEITHPGWLEEMLQIAIQPAIGIVGAKLNYPDGSLQHGGVFVPTVNDVPGHSHKGTAANAPGYHGRLLMPQDMSAVTAACLLIKRSVFEKVHGFDEKYFLAFGDVDLCLKVREDGWRIVWTPYSELVHYESQTRGYEDTPEKKKRFDDELRYFRQKWERTLTDGDPYFNPNLIAKGDFRFGINSEPYNQNPSLYTNSILIRNYPSARLWGRKEYNFCCMCRKNLEISPEKVFLLFGLFFGLIFVFLSPVNYPPDELAHFSTTYIYGEGKYDLFKKTPLPAEFINSFDGLVYIQR